MIELTHHDDSTLRLGYAGDTYNTAVYLRRVADELCLDLEIGYLTGIGADEYSAAMRAAWAAEGIADRAILVANRQPGLYAIRVDPAGERRFSYWREQSAARALFTGTEWLDRLDADLVYLSGITLQLMTPHSRAGLISRLRELRATGVRIVFDTNYRPAGWPGRDVAASAMDAVAGSADVVLATLDDETALHDVVSPADAVARLAALGPAEVVVKAGADGAWLAHGTHIPAVTCDSVADTTAAGDSFAAGYLAARLTGSPPTEAAALGARVAATVIAHPGAIIPRGPLATIDAGAGSARRCPNDYWRNGPEVHARQP
jgi:2-dehydro-3-deoxygluconokinase